MNYEYELLHKDTGNKAVVQVKNGYNMLTTDEFSNIESTVYLFTTRGGYKGNKRDNIHFVDPRQMEDFVFNNLEIMPEKIRNWTEILKEIKEK